MKTTFLNFISDLPKIKCFTCNESSTIAECQRNQQLRICRHGETSCGTLQSKYTRNGVERLNVQKGCVLDETCKYWDSELCLNNSRYRNSTDRLVTCNLTCCNGSGCNRYMTTSTPVPTSPFPSGLS